MSLFDLIYKVKFNLFKNETFDDFADRLSFKFSCLLFMAPSILISVKQYFVRPISCYISTEPGGKYLKDYMENYCFVEGTIPINFSENFPTNEKEWKIAEQKKILYYQWIPFILTLQALGCYIPQLIWRLVYINNSGKEMDSLISKVNHAMDLDNESRSKEVNHLAKTLEGMIFQSPDEKSDKRKALGLCHLKKIYECLILGKRLGAYLMIFYLLIKVLYLINSISQLYLMKALLCRNISDCNFPHKDIFSFFKMDKNWEETSTFPRIGYCRAKLRHLGITNFVVAQCSLPINMLNENVYIFLWYWMLILSIITFMSIVRWVWKLFVQFNKSEFLSKYLKINDAEEFKKIPKGLIKRFETKFLKHNGYFILKMIANNSGDLIIAEIVSKLFDIYKTKHFGKSASFSVRKCSDFKRGSSWLLKLKKGDQDTVLIPNAPCEEEKL